MKSLRLLVVQTPLLDKHSRNHIWNPLRQCAEGDFLSLLRLYFVIQLRQIQFDLNWTNHTIKPLNMSHSEILEKEFISIAELMELFDISRATAQRLLKKGEVKSVKLGGKVIIPTKPLREKFA